MARLWVREIRRNRIYRQETVACEWGAQQEALGEALKTLDLPMPMWLSKHEKEFDSFRRTAFLPDHFIESVSFERLEIEYLDGSEKKRKSADPRNQF